MKTITLKLTKQEDDRLYSLMVRTDLLKKILYFDGKCNVEIKDADKFREFLKDEIGLIDYMSKTGNKNASWKQITINDKILKSILSKLDKAEAKSLRMEIDKEFDKNFPDGQKIDDLQNTLYKLDKAVVQNDEPKSFKTEEELVKYFRSIGDENYNDASDQYLLDEAWALGEWEEDDKGGYRLIQNDEPKCTKCGSEFEDEIWKTPATDYEEYICSNDKCCAVHTISIDRNDEEDGEVDIERHWDTLEFDYIWEQGLKKDEPKDELLDKAKALIKAIDDNLWSLWENDVEVKHDCVLWYKDEYQLNMDENDNWETEEKEGISKAYTELKELIELIIGRPFYFKK